MPRAFQIPVFILFGDFNSCPEPSAEHFTFSELGQNPLLNKDLLSTEVSEVDKKTMKGRIRAIGSSSISSWIPWTMSLLFGILSLWKVFLTVLRVSCVDSCYFRISIIRKYAIVITTMSYYRCRHGGTQKWVAATYVAWRTLYYGSKWKENLKRIYDERIYNTSAYRTQYWNVHHRNFSTPKFNV